MQKEMSYGDYCNIIENMTCPPYHFIPGKMGDGYFLQLGHHRVDTVSGATGMGKGRKWYISRWMTKNEVVQTALLGAIMMAEHAVREAFRYRGHVIYSPHLDPEELVKFKARGSAVIDVREVLE